MEHKVLQTSNAGRVKTTVVQLIPETEDETSTLNNVEVYEADDAEREIVNQYLLFTISTPVGYAFTAADPLGGHKMSIKYTKI